MIAKADFDTCTHTNGIDTWFPFLPMEHHTMTEDRPSAFVIYCAYVYCACEAAFGSPHSRHTSIQVLSLGPNLPISDNGKSCIRLVRLIGKMSLLSLLPARPQAVSPFILARRYLPQTRVVIAEALDLASSDLGRRGWGKSAPWNYRPILGSGNRQIHRARLRSLRH